ncbi:MAG: hypothetical protein WCF44_15080 [Candidatus Methylophosphatis roskildensis]
MKTIISSAMESSGELGADRARPREQASEAYRRICTWENLLEAHRKAALGKRGHRAPAAFEYRLADHLLALKHDLECGSYRPGPYVHFHIHEPKRRKISAAPFRDRVLHHALCNVVEPRFERLFIPDSYANRVGKGTHRAIDRLQQFANRYRYVLRADIVKHFPSIDHAVLRATLARTIPEDDVMALIDRVLASGAGVLDEEYEMVYFPGDDLLAACRSAISPRSSGRTACFIPSTSSSPAGCAVPPTCVTWTTSRCSATASANCGRGSGRSWSGWRGCA